VAVLAVLGGVTASAWVLKTYLGRDSRFRIAGTDNIEAIGLTQVSRAEMLPVFGEDVGRNIFFIPLNERRKQLEAIPWVEHASVMRLLPDQIRVSIVERQPVAFVRQGQQIGLVDKDGVLLTMPPAMMAQHNYSFPVVTGLEASDPLPLRRARMAVYERLLTELDSNGQNLSQQISEIDLTDPQDARVLLPEQGMDILAHFGDDRFLDRYQRYKTHIAEWHQQYPKLAAVDLRYENQVVLEMTPGASAVAAPLDGTNPQPAPNAPPAAESASAQTPPPSPAKPAPAKLDSAKIAPAKPAASKPAAAKAVASIKTDKTDKPARPEVKRASAKESPAGNSKAAKKKTPEMLAAEQRKSREHAQNERAAREKTEKAKTEKAKTDKDKKRAAQQHTAQNLTKPRPSTHSAAGAAQGQ
jgi:cell division protein FtsQ